MSIPNITPTELIVAQNGVDGEIVIGIDEVGRGALFGPMSVAAVIMPAPLSGAFADTSLPCDLSALGDSKKLTAKKRLQLDAVIRRNCQSLVIIDIPAAIIDKINIYHATLLGMKLATEQLIIRNQLSPACTTIMIDGNALPSLTGDFLPFSPRLTALVKGDSLHTSIACASIIAKVHRDRVISGLGKRYPNYGFDKHKGYPTAQHLFAIDQYGVLPKHRQSYAPIKKRLA